MIIKFSEVGINEHFCFADDDYGWIGDCIKISPQRYALCTTNKPIIVRTRYATRLCKVDNTCACTEPRQLTFNDLSIGAIFIIGSTWYAQVDNEHKYCKLDNMHYCNFYDSRLFTISSINIVVSTPDYVRSAQ